MTGKFFALYWCHLPIWGVNVSPLANKSLETRRQAISPFACNFLDGITILPVFCEHCTLMTTPEMGKIYSNYLHFLSYLLKCPVDNTKFQAPKFKHFLGKHAPRRWSPVLWITFGLLTFFLCVHFKKYHAMPPKGLVKKYRGGGPEQRGGGSRGFEPCAKGGSCNFQLPLGGGSPYFIT